MIDTWRASASLTRLDKAIGYPRGDEVSKIIDDIEYEIQALECEEEHCDDEHGNLIDPEPPQRYIHAKISRIKLGLHREDHDGDLLTVLEEIERILR